MVVRCAIWLLFVAVLAGCDATKAPPESGPVDTVPVEVHDPVHSTDSPNELVQAVEQARAELAERLGVEAGQIRTVAAEFVTWPNGALGCPEPGMMYTMALVPGYRIVLESNGALHHYHGARGKAPFHCPADRAAAPKRGPSAD